MRASNQFIEIQISLSFTFSLFSIGSKQGTPEHHQHLLPHMTHMEQPPFCYYGHPTLILFDAPVRVTLSTHLFDLKSCSYCPALKRWCDHQSNPFLIGVRFDKNDFFPILEQIRMREKRNLTKVVMLFNLNGP